LQVFTTCATFLLLTATVMQRADDDGFQATHLFFMPRRAWEMDEGRGMLHEEEYYREIDERVTLEEIYGFDAEFLEQIEERQEYKEEAALAGSSRPEQDALENSHKMQVRRTPRPRPFPSRGMPALALMEAYCRVTVQVVALEQPPVSQTSWHPDVPSPPPRIAH
jgi:hypothetical protein